MTRLKSDPDTDADIDSAFRENLRPIDYGKVLAERGIATVTVDDAGRLIRRHPDGTSVVLDTPGP